ncbi:MAG TPA: glycosyltransferase family 4 protein [Solirubrobacterales bacterium]
MARLIHLAAYSPAHAGSFVPFLRTVLDAGQGRGWSVAAVLPGKAAGRDWADEFEQAAIPVTYMDGSRRSLTRRIRDCLGDGDEPTILHTHFTSYDLPSALAARGRPNVTVYWHIHTVLSGRPRARLANGLKFTLARRGVDRLLTPAEDVATELIRRGAPRDKVSVFPNTIDSRAFGMLSPAQRAASREDLEIPADREVLLHFGRDWQIKDGDIFLDALAALLEQGRPVTGVISQGGDVARQAARRRGLEEQVRVIAPLPSSHDLYGVADLLVASSRGETMPFAVIEALCSGIPVVASDLAGHRYLSDRVRSCVIAPRDSAQMAAAIATFLDMDPRERRAQAEASHAWVREHLDVREAAGRLLDEYEQSFGGASRLSGGPR